MAQRRAQSRPSGCSASPPIIANMRGRLTCSHQACPSLTILTGPESAPPKRIVPGTDGRTDGGRWGGAASAGEVGATVGRALGARRQWQPHVGRGVGVLGGESEKSMPHLQELHRLVVEELVPIRELLLRFPHGGLSSAVGVGACAVPGLRTAGRYGVGACSAGGNFALCLTPQRSSPAPQARAAGSRVIRDKPKGCERLRWRDPTRTLEEEGGPSRVRPR